MAASGTVTLLFTDIVGSTALLDRVGDDAAEPIRRTHLRVLRSAVAGRDGHEVKNLGDGLMVVFPSAVDALACAVAMQQAVHRQSQRDDSVPLGLRVGLHAGEPIRDEDDYFGTPVVIAKRLCDSAEGGQIIASDVVRSLAGTRGGHLFRPLGSLELKGLAEPVAACEVAWEPAGAERSVPAALTTGERTAFVGREDERARLRKVWHQAAETGVALVMISGEPGIGKTRLAGELAGELHRDGAVVLYGRCDEETPLPYQPFVEALRPYLGPTPLDELRRRAGLTAERVSRAPLPTQSLGGEDPERYLFYEAVSSLLDEAAIDAPLLIVLDDLHWADRPTLQLLKHLTRRSGTRQLLVLGTYRETELGRTHPLSQVLADLRREKEVERVALVGLDEAGVHTLVHTWVEGAEAPAGVSQAVFRETEGNPFFVEEVCRHLAETGAMARADFRIDRLGIPQGVKDVLGRRLSRLSEQCNRMLRVASVVGRDFTLPVLVKVSDVDEDVVLDALEEAMAAHVVEEVGALDSYTFSHALVRETLYGELATSRRVRLHRRVAHVLEELHANSDRLASVLAYHFFEAAEGGDADKAVDYAKRAGDQALATAAFEEAARLYELALQAAELLPVPDERRQCEALLGLVKAQEVVDWELSLATADRALDMARRVGDGELLARVVLAGFAFDPASGPGNEPARLKEALDALPPGDSDWRAMALAALSLCLVFTDREQAAVVRRQALEMTVIDPEAKAFILFWTQGDRDLLETGDELLRLTEGSSSIWRADGHTLRFAGLLERGDVEASDTEIEHLSSEAFAATPMGRGVIRTLRATRLLLGGQLDEAERAARDSMAEWSRAVGSGGRGANFAFVIYAIQNFAIRREQGRSAELEEGARGIKAAYPNALALHVGLGAILADLNREAEAAAELDRWAENDFAGLVPVIARGDYSIWLVTEVCARLGDAERAALLYPQLTAHRGKAVLQQYGPVTAVCAGAADRYLGLLAATIGRHDDAEDHFRAALELDTRMGGRPWLAHTQHEYAALLLRRGRPGDRVTAGELIARAGATADEIGMLALARKIAATQEGR
ncbi:MAG: hypothetical protein QOC92_3046 [Acidimicrobiaceae bacterium]